MDVYADLLFLINFSMDFLCLFLSIKLLHLPRKTPRMLLAAALGGIYSVAALFIQARAGVSLAVDLAMCLAMCAVCAAGKGVKVGRLLLLCGTYFGISALMGGGMTALYHLLNRADLPIDSLQGDGVSAWLFLLLATLAALSAAFGGRLFAKQTAQRFCTLCVRLDGVKWEMEGLCDSGNLLCDPISGTPVIVVDREVWLGSLPQSLRRIVESGGRESDIGAQCKRVRIVPMHTSQGSALAVALFPDEVLIGQKNGRSRVVQALIAPSGQPLPGEICAIVPAVLLQ